MDTKTFLQAVIGDEGFYCSVSIKLPKQIKSQRFFKTIDEVIADGMQIDAQGLNAYFALGTFVTDENRTQENVRQMRSLFLDLDCGPEVGDKGYPNQNAAVAALRAFCKQTSFPRPTLVNSGRGVHVYWPFTKPIEHDEWMPLAARFKRFCVNNGLRTDPSATADSARVLRLPGTHNYKDSPAKSVEFFFNSLLPTDVEVFREILASTPLVLPRKGSTPRGPDAMMDALAGNYQSRFKTILMKSVEGKGCAQIAYLTQNQPSVPEPLWRAGLSVAVRCVDGDKAIHLISKHHPEYDPDETERKANATQGPYRCATFDEYRAGVCTECQHWGKFGSPIVLGREVLRAPNKEIVVIAGDGDAPDTGGLFDDAEPAEAGDPDEPQAVQPQHYIIPKFPEPYFRGQDGGVYRRVRTKEDNFDDLLVFHHDVYVIRRLTIPTVGDAIVVRVHLPRDGVREFTIPMAVVVVSDELKRHLAMHGVTVIKADVLVAYFTAWVNELQYRASADEARVQFGWTTEEGGSFVVGDREVTATGTQLNPPSAATAGLFPAFKPRGTLDGWKRMVDFYNRPGFESHQFVVAKAFGSVLMQFLPINGTIMHVHSKESGLGKTTAMYVGASVWGNPDVLVLQERDTLNAKMNRAEVYKNLPLYVDEMTNTAPKDLSDFAYQIPSGQQRSRLSIKGNVERHRGVPWKLLCVTTGNTSMIERIGTYKTLPKAEAQRILEYRTSRVAGLTKAETDEFNKKIRENYGHAGPVFVQYVLNNLGEVNRILNALQRQFDNAAELSSENRFWSADVAATLAGAYFAKQAGLVGWEVGPLFKWAVNTARRAVTMTDSMDVSAESTLTDYLAENYNNTLRIKSTDDLRGVNTGLDHLIHPESTPRGALVARYEYDVKRLYLLPKPLKDWCAKQQINYSSFIDNLKAGRTQARMERIRLGKGTHVNMPATEVISVECGGFLDDFAEPVRPSDADPAGTTASAVPPETEALHA